MKQIGTVWNDEEIPLTTPCPKCGRPSEFIVATRKGDKRYAVYSCPEHDTFDVPMKQ